MKNRILITLLLSFFIWNCSSDDNSIKEDEKVEDIKGKVVFKSSEKQLKLLDTINLLDELSITGKVDIVDILWFNSNEKVVELQQEKLVVIADGEATITVRLKGTSKSSTLRIIALPMSIEVLENAINVNMSEHPTLDLSKLLILENIEKEDLVWSGEFNGYATIEQNGVITFLKNGRTDIEVHVKNKDIIRAHISIMASGGKYDNLWIEVRPPSNEVRINEKYQYKFGVTPEDSDISRLVWSSSDPSIATVDNNGVVEGKSVGIVIISVTAPNGVKASLEVGIISGDITRVSLDSSSWGIQLINGDEFPLVVYTDPYDADMSLVGFSTSDPSRATVNDKGIVKTQRGQSGKVYITGYSKQDPSIKDVLEVELVDAFYRVWGFPSNQGISHGSVFTGQLYYLVTVGMTIKVSISEFKVFDKYGNIVYQDDREMEVGDSLDINYSCYVEKVDSPYVTYKLKYKDHQEIRRESFNI